MVQLEAIREVSNRIAASFKPERIVLFGSYAYGSPTEDSDVDLLVVLTHERKSADVAAEILSETRSPFPLDILVRTPEQVAWRLSMNDFFIREIVENGKVLFAADHG